MTLSEIISVYCNEHMKHNVLCRQNPGVLNTTAAGKTGNHCAVTVLRGFGVVLILAGETVINKKYNLWCSLKR